MTVFSFETFVRMLVPHDHHALRPETRLPGNACEKLAWAYAVDERLMAIEKELNIAEIDMGLLLKMETLDDLYREVCLQARIERTYDRLALAA